MAGTAGWVFTLQTLPNEKTTILMGMQKVDAGTFSMTRKIRNRIVKQAVKKIENSVSLGNCCLPETAGKERMKDPLFINSNPEEPGFLKFIAAGKVRFHGIALQFKTV